MSIIKNLNVRNRMKLVNVILKNIEEKLLDSSETDNQLSAFFMQKGNKNSLSKRCAHFVN